MKNKYQYIPTIVLVALGGLVIFGWHIRPTEAVGTPIREPSPCREVATNPDGTPIKDCTDPNLKIETVTVTDLRAKNTMRVIQTKYSRADSCHNKKTVNGKVLCLTAIGKDTVEGRTVACPRSLPLGTKIVLDGHTYVCEDRYAKYLDSERDLPTIDVFLEAENLARFPSKRVLDITILK